ncbi:Pro-Pol polyprotein [Thelohanellus kitauei]|uniref:Pro-Pol polyprotein n=1 Tax=Thelohanellus kitauei TaxID=669202 RepID=A0A0C2J8M1_THEKT|nr:Pro-Pol polyprotein [Thelohanellus kitauei]
MVAEDSEDQFICRFGAPEIIHTDQGKNLELKLFYHMCNVRGIIKTRPTPYRPQSDGMIERFYRTIGNLLTNSLSDNTEWDKLLPKLLSAYRSSVHKSTAIT